MTFKELRNAPVYLSVFKVKAIVSASYRNTASSGFSFNLRGSVTQLKVSWHRVYTAFQFPIHEETLCSPVV